MRFEEVYSHVRILIQNTNYEYKYSQPYYMLKCLTFTPKSDQFQISPAASPEI